MNPEFRDETSGSERAERLNLISVPIPDNFAEMDLSSRIFYVSNSLKSLESEYPIGMGSLVRRVSLSKTEQRSFVYSVEYLRNLNDGPEKRFPDDKTGN